MTPLSHAEAHERITDLALEPGALDRLGPAESESLAAHIATCDPCRREIAAWRRTEIAVEAAKGTGPDRVALADLAGEVPISAPAELRARIAAVPARRPVPAPTPPAPASGSAAAVAIPQPRARRQARVALPLVAVLAVALAAAGLLVEQASRLDKADGQIALLEGMTASLDRVLNDPDHAKVELRTADGTPAGTLAWSRHDLVVLTTVLEAPPEGRVYRCWIEREGRRSPVGRMWFAGETAFWNGALDEWATISLDAGGTFGVSLEPADGAPEGNPAVLSADLGS